MLYYVMLYHLRRLPWLPWPPWPPGLIGERAELHPQLLRLPRDLPGMGRDTVKLVGHHRKVTLTIIAWL